VIEKRDTPEYLEELASTLASHGSNLAALRMAELEKRVAPSLTPPGLPHVPVSHDQTSVTGRVSLYADVANALADPTFESIPGTFFNLTQTTWTRLSPYWEARYILDSGPAPSSVQLYIFETRTNPHNDGNTSRIALQASNSTGSAMTGGFTIELRSRPTTYNSGYNSPFFVGAIRARHSGFAAMTTCAIDVSICDVKLSDAVLSTSGPVTMRVGGAWTQPDRYSTALSRLGSYYEEAYLLVRHIATYVGVPSGYSGGLVWTILSEPQLVQTFSVDPPPFSPLLGMWPPSQQGWVPPTGTAARTSFNTDSVTLVNLARAVKAIIDDLTRSGFLGPAAVKEWGIATVASATGTGVNATTTST
jgi:hypothetical protein